MRSRPWYLVISCNLRTKTNESWFIIFTMSNPRYIIIAKSAWTKKKKNVSRRKLRQHTKHVNLNKKHLKYILKVLSKHTVFQPRTEPYVICMHLLIIWESKKWFLFKVRSTNTKISLLIPITNSTISSIKDAKKELITFDWNSTLILALLRKFVTQKARKKRESKLKSFSE